MRIKEIKVEGLFGMFNHTIPINDSGITIVYGENGIGKTMLFKLVTWLFDLGNEDSRENIKKAPFKSFMIVFDDFTAISIEKDDSEIGFVYSDEQGIKHKYRFERNLAQGLMDDLNTNARSPIKRKDGRDDDLLLPLDDILELTKKINVYFIQTQRLLSFASDDIKSSHNVFSMDLGGDSVAWSKTQIREKKEKPPYKYTATEYANELSTQIKKKTAEYRKLSDDLKNSLSQRILSRQVKIDQTIQELQEMADKVDEKRAKLKEVGLIEQYEKFHIPNEISNIEQAILAVNIQDVLTQLEIYEQEHFYERLHLFIEILNERRLSYKKIIVSAEIGFSFINDNQKSLKPEDLSSGEQHELVLLYQLLFKIPENALILIDEPEISLHVSWQKDFISDMSDIIKLRKFDILLATHSPSIINGNWDLTVSLTGRNHGKD